MTRKLTGINPIFIQRALDLDALLERSSPFLLGPRQAGKMTPIRHSLGRRVPLSARGRTRPDYEYAQAAVVPSSSLYGHAPTTAATIRITSVAIRNGRYSLNPNAPEAM